MYEHYFYFFLLLALETCKLGRYLTYFSVTTIDVLNSSGDNSLTLVLGLYSCTLRSE